MTPYPLLLGSTRLLNFGNLSSLPIFSLPYAYPFSRKCLPYPFIRHISTLPVYLIFKNIPLYPLIRVYPFIRHLRVCNHVYYMHNICIIKIVQDCILKTFENFLFHRLCILQYKNSIECCSCGTNTRSQQGIPPR